MGGIIGFQNVDTQLNQEQIISNMLESIKHRGPKQVTTYIDDQVTLGQRGKAEVGYGTAGVQHSSGESGESIILFLDGHIYNIEELSHELKQQGSNLTGTSREEVLRQAYLAYGLDFLPRIRGVFALTVWDKPSKSLYVARDFFGVKPLYYTQHTSDNSLLFASEIKALLHHPHFRKELNKQALKPYLTFQYPVLEETFFQGVYKLKPGHYLHYQEGKVSVREYTDVRFAVEDGSLEEYVQQIKSTVQESVRTHQQGASQVGSFLSGGIDSSYITALLQPEKSFSVGFQDYEGIFNETNLAEGLADILEIPLYKKMLSADECFEHLPLIQYHLDEPQSNPSCVPLFFLAELASQHVQVVFSGEGADELFGGYALYQLTPTMQKYTRLPFALRRLFSNVSKALPRNRITSFLIKGGQKVEEWFIGQAKVFEEQDALNMLAEEYRQAPSVENITRPIYAQVQNADDLTKQQYLDLKLWMPGDILLKADKLTAAHSLDVRVPFLDREVLSLATKLPDQLRVDVTQSKYALRVAAEEVLPEAWAKRPKVGFPVPIRHWLREEKYYQLVKEMFQSELATSFFKTQTLVNYLDQHYNGTANYARQIWTVYVFLVWYKKFFVELD